MLKPTGEKVHLSPLPWQQAPLTSISQHQTWRQHSLLHWQHLGGVSSLVLKHPISLHTRQRAHLSPFPWQQAPLGSISQHQTWRQHSLLHWQHVGGVSSLMLRHPIFNAETYWGEGPSVTVAMATGTLNVHLTAPNLAPTLTAALATPWRC